MKHLELHIIQSVPVACLNRDDLEFAQDGRLWGCAARAGIQPVVETRDPGDDGRERLRFARTVQGKAKPPFHREDSAQRLTAIGEAETTANALSLCAGHYLAKLDPKQEGKVKTLVFLSPLEYETFATTSSLAQRCGQTETC